MTVSNSDSRRHILGSIRRNNGADPGAVDSFDLALPANQPLTDLLPHFINKVHAVKATTESGLSIDDIPGAVLKFACEAGISPAAVIAPDSRLKNLAWPEEFNCRFDCAVSTDMLGVSIAFAAIASSGTLVMYSSPESPISINFLPDNHLVVLLSSRIVANLEDLWPLLDQWPRALNLITGPSKTGDVEQTIVYGAHGPRRLHILMVD